MKSRSQRNSAQGAVDEAASPTRTELVGEFCAAPDDALFDEKVIAAYIGCSTEKLQRDRWAGVGLPFVNVGRLVRYRKGTVRGELKESRPLRSVQEQAAA